MSGAPIQTPVEDAHAAREVERILTEETEKLRGEINDADKFAKYYEPASKLIADLTIGEGDFVEFLTLPAYELVS